MTGFSDIVVTMAVTTRMKQQTEPPEENDRGSRSVSLIKTQQFSCRRSSCGVRDVVLLRVTAAKPHWVAVCMQSAAPGAGWVKQALYAPHTVYIIILELRH